MSMMGAEGLSGDEVGRAVVKDEVVDETADARAPASETMRCDLALLSTGRSSRRALRAAISAAFFASNQVPDWLLASVT